MHSKFMLNCIQFMKLKDYQGYERKAQKDETSSLVCLLMQEMLTGATYLVI